MTGGLMSLDRGEDPTHQGASLQDSREGHGWKAIPFVPGHSEEPDCNDGIGKRYAAGWNMALTRFFCIGGQKHVLMGSVSIMSCFKW